MFEDAENKKIYKSFSFVIPEEEFILYQEKIIIDASLNVQKITPKSFLDFNNNYSEIFQNLLSYMDSALADYNFESPLIKIGPAFYFQNWSNEKFLSLLQDNLKNVEKELRIFVVESDGKGSVSAHGETIYLDANYLIGIKYINLSEITLKNIENTKFICTWRRYG